jgi:hypothetical protein
MVIAHPFKGMGGVNSANAIEDRPLRGTVSRHRRIARNQRNMLKIALSRRSESQKDLLKNLCPRCIISTVEEMVDAVIFTTEAPHFTG